MTALDADRPIRASKIDHRNGFDLYETPDRGALYACPDGTFGPTAGAWGPAADRTGNWFAWREGVNPIRVDDRQAAIDYITSKEQP